jgi:hypothetical protein
MRQRIVSVAVPLGVVVLVGLAIARFSATRNSTRVRLRRVSSHNPIRGSSSRRPVPAAALAPGPLGIG